VTIRLLVRDTATRITVNRQIKPISLPANVLRLSILLRGRRDLLLRETLRHGHEHARLHRRFRRLASQTICMTQVNQSTF
jgi:hypothetical protein